MEAKLNEEMELLGKWISVDWESYWVWQRIYYLSSWMTFGTSRPTSNYLNKERECCILLGSQEHIQHVGEKAGRCFPVWLILGDANHIAWFYFASQNAIAKANFTQGWPGKWSSTEGHLAAGCPQTPLYLPSQLFVKGIDIQINTVINFSSLPLLI